MSNKARKERKRAGVPFVRVPKTGTPVAERAIAWSLRMVGGKLTSRPSSREIARRQRRAEALGEES